MTYEANSALIVVDMQNDFADPSGSLFVAGGDSIVGAINAEAESVADAGGLVVLTQDWHPPVTAHFIEHGGVWPVHCVRETWGAELHPELTASGPVVRKGTGGEDGYSGFSMRDPDTGEESQTGLDALLREHRVTNVTVVGLALDVCVEATASDALANGYGVRVLTDLSASVNLSPGDDERAILKMREAGISVQ